VTVQTEAKTPETSGFGPIELRWISCRQTGKVSVHLRL